MSLEEKVSRYGTGAGTNTSTISGRLETLAREVKNLVTIQGRLEGTARTVENLSQISGNLDSIAREVKALGAPSGRHEDSGLSVTPKSPLAKQEILNGFSRYEK